MCCRESRSFADLVGTGFPPDHTVIGTGYHRLLIETVRIASALNHLGGARAVPTTVTSAKAMTPAIDGWRYAAGSSWWASLP